MKRTPLLLAVLAAAVLAPASTAVAVPVVAREFDLGGRPERLALGPDGNVWVTISGGRDDVAKVEPNGAVTGYDVADLAFSGGITAGPDGRLWVTQSGAVASFSPSDPSRARRFAVTEASARTIVTGPDRRLWTVGNDRALQIDPVTEAVARFPVAGMTNANGITSGRDGRLYITDTNGGRIIALTTAGAATPIAVGGSPQQVLAALGTQIVYSNPGTDPQELGLLQPTGALLRAPVPRTDPFGIALGRDGAYWVANFASGDLTRLTPEGQTSRLGGFTPNAGPRYLTAGLNGTLWVGLETTNRIALVTGLDVPVDPPVVNPPPLPPGGGETPPSAPPRLTPLPEPPRAPVLGRLAARTTVAGRAATFKTTVAGATRANVTVTQSVAGRRVSGRCVRPTRRNARARACRRTVTKLTTSASVRNGAISVTLGSRLGVGSYRVTVIASNAVGRTTASTTLRVTAKPPTRSHARAHRGR